MLYSGVDLIEIARIEQAIARWGDLFLRRVYTPAELAAYRTRVASLAVRWAAKEATAKALGVGLRGLGAGQSGAVSWLDIEVLSDSTGRPTLTLTGGAYETFQQQGLYDITLSLSHTREYAIAQVVALGS